MLPIYCLSVVFNALTGYILAFCGDETDDDSGITLHLTNGTLRFTLGAASLVTGVLKLLSPVAGILVLGDLVPALANLGGGFILVFEFYRSRTSLSQERVEQLEEFILKNRKLLGFAALGAGFLHLFFSPIFFL